MPYENQTTLMYTIQYVNGGFPNTPKWASPDTVKFKQYVSELIFIKELYDNKICPVYREAQFFNFIGEDYEFNKTYLIAGDTPDEDEQLALSVSDGITIWELKPNDYPEITSDARYIFQLPDGATLHYKNDSGFVKLVSGHCLIKRIQ